MRILDRKVTDAPDDDAEEASKRYGIAVKKDGHRTPPEGYPKDREQYGDPVNYEYPIDREHIQAAVDYFQKKKDHTEGGYSDEEWSKIGKRITEAANRLLHKGYEYRDGDIVDTKHTQDSKGGIRMQIKLPTRGKARVKDVLAAAGLKIFAMDAEPEEVMEAVDALAEESREDDDEKAKSDDASKQTTDDPGDQAKLDQVLEMLKSMNERIDNLEKGKTSDEKTAEEMLDEAIAKADGGESETIEPEETHDNDAGPVMPEEDRPQSGLTGDSKRVFLQSIKPIIAAIPDEPTRRKVVDTAIASLKGRSGANVYGQMVRDTNKQVRERQQQTQQAQVIDYADLGEQIRNKYNPHYKNQQA